ncbi:MAG: EscU/YscU/HrcU family type III secretion system export apparatus switch protein, partial [Candidatus Thiodiazotropha sp. 6PLUC3]
MADNENGQEKTEQPSSKRLDDAKRKGQVPRSRELNSMAVTLGGVICLVIMSGSVGDSMSQMMSDGFVITREQIFDINAMSQSLGEGVAKAFIAIVPYFLLVIVAAILSSVALGGFSISAESMTPKLSKLSPLKGLKRMFSAKSLVEMLKAMAKFLFIGGTTILLLRATLDQYLALHNMEITPALQHLSALI